MRTLSRTPRSVMAVAAGFAAAVVPAIATASSAEERDAITLIAYESFPTEGTPLNDAIAAWSAETGIGVEIVIAGDTGTMVSKAVLTAGNPEGDVMFGVDNTFLSRVVSEEVFEPYEATDLDGIDPALLELVPNGEATPVDFGDVCVNYDIEWFADHDLDPPTDLDSLADPAYRDLLVVENPASSSPGLAFLMAAVAEFGEPQDGDGGWIDFWTRLLDNGVEVVDGWTEAYYERFSGASDGPRPLVVSYGSSPPFEVLYSDPPVAEPTTGVLAETCFRQVEFAGVLRGTDAPDEAREFVDFLISQEFQSQVALNLFVFPVNLGVELDQVFTEFAVVPDEPYTIDPELIAQNREDWIEIWTDTVLR
jgi:thiamine transport system substrate-binding protein